jgi:hypothetical protein
MKPRIHIRPRIWLALPKPLARLGWVPLSLIFRRQRLNERPVKSAAGSHISLFNVVSFLAQIRRYHTNEGRQIFARSIQHHHFLLNRVAAQRPASARDSQRPEASVFHERHRERSIETLLRFSRLVESKQSFRATRRVWEITKHLAENRPPRFLSAETMATTPAHRLLVIPELLRLRLFDAASPFSHQQQEANGAMRRQTAEAVVEGRLTPRLRKADPQPGSNPPALTVPSVKQVWRQPQPAARESSSETRRLPTAAQATPVDSPTQHRVDLLPPAPASTILPGKVDSPTMERIAEDVMKRIERHLRIERERRGM